MLVEFHENGTSLSSHETPSYLLIMKLLSRLALATHFRNVAGIFFHFLVTLFFRFIIEGDNAHESRIRCAIMTHQCFVSLAMKFNIFYFFYFFAREKSAFITVMKKYNQVSVVQKYKRELVISKQHYAKYASLS